MPNCWRKRKNYAEYRRSCEEMRELLTAKANVDRLLKTDEEQKKEQEKDQKKTMTSGEPVMVQSVRRTRSRRMKFCVQRGLGALPSTSKQRGKSQRDFLLCGPVCINTGIACLFSPKLKRTSERIVKFHSLAQFVSNFSDNSVSSFTVSWV